MPNSYYYFQDVDPDQIVDSDEGRKNRKEINQKESLEKDQIKQEQSESDEEIIRKRKRALGKNINVSHASNVY